MYEKREEEQGWMEEPVSYTHLYANRRRYARFLAEEAMQRWENWMREKRIEAIVPVPMLSLIHI